VVDQVEHLLEEIIILQEVLVEIVYMFNMAENVQLVVVQ
jgi:hypothetical protein